MSGNVHCRPYTAMHEAGYFADPYSEVGFLNQSKDYIYRFFIPVASF